MLVSKLLLPRSVHLLDVVEVLFDRRAGGHRFTVLANGFEWQGDVFPSLSAVAKAITGSHTSGFLFFGLDRNGGRA